MDTISSLSSGTYSSNETVAASQGQSSEELYNTWITLLAAELEHQDPTDPVDTTEYTSQLMSLSQIEQQSLTNDTLEALLNMAQSVESDGANSYLGRTVTAEGDRAPMADGQAEWVYALDSEASSVTIEVSDLNGNLVYTAEERNQASGNHQFAWDGTTNSGKQANDGAYVLSVSAIGTDGQAVNTDTSIRGKVTAIDASGADVNLLLGNVSVPKNSVSATQI